MEFMQKTLEPIPELELMIQKLLSAKTSFLKQLQSQLKVI
jgi:hypothetical protein